MNVSFFRHIKNLCFHHKRFLKNVLWVVAPYIKNDFFYVKLKYFVILGHKLNLRNPKTFSEKLQWIKFNDNKPIYHDMVDKFEAKRFIAQKVGSEYLIPTIGVWNSFEEINFDALPNEFILKNTHDSGTYYRCKNKKDLDVEKARLRLLSTWNIDYYVYSREWPYKGIKPRIIAEPLLHDKQSNFLIDYKFYTFNGEPKFFFVGSDRINGLKIDFYDCKGNFLSICQKGYQNSIDKPTLPLNLAKMVEIARELSQNTYHLRVDFYEVEGKLYVGEMTFFDDGGFAEFTPKEFDRICGDMIHLPVDK